MVSSDLLSDENPLTEITDLQPGDHLCCIYETEEEHRNVLTPFIKEGLEANEKVIYIVDTNTAEEIVDYLRKIDYPPEPYLDSGQLVLLTGDESYLKGGTFDPDAMIDLLGKETKKALEQGYSALRVTGEMTWVLRDLPGSDRLMEYENKLNRFFPSHKALGMCQYDKNQFDADVLLGVLRTHPIAVIGDETYENFHYIQPSKLLGDNPKEAEFSSWEEGLLKSKDNKLHLQHRNSLLRSIRDLNQLIVQEDDRGRLLKSVCEILQETRDYDYTWIALLDDSSEVEALAQSGLGEKVEKLSQVLDKDQLPDHLQEALDEPGVKVTPDTEYHFTDERLEPSKDKSLMTCRLEAGEKVYGLLSVSASDQGFYPQEELDLLAEVAGDIAFALQGIEIEKERERVTRELARQKRLLSQTQSLAKVGGWEYDVEEDQITWTEETYQIYGVDKEEYDPNDVQEDINFYSPEDKETVQEAFNKAVTEGEPYDLEVQFNSADGEKLWVRTVGQPIEDNGQVTKVVGHIMDITEQKEKEEQLDRSEKRYRTVFENTGTAMIIIEEDTTISLANKKTEELTGYSREKLEGKMSWTELVANDEDLERMKEYHRKRREDPAEAPNQYEFKLIDSAGNEKDILITIDVVPGTSKSIASLIDITERKKAEREKREQEERFRSYVENSPLGIFVMDGQGNYVEVNEAASRVTGYGREELLNMNGADLIPEEHKSEAENHFRSVVEKGEAAGEFPILRKDGTKRYWTVKAVKLSEDRFLGFVNDVTERKKMEQRIEKERDKAQQYLDIAGSIIVLLDEDRKIQEINKKGCQILGYDREEIIGKDIYENFVPERAREDVIEDTRKLIMEGNTDNASYYENPIVTKDGEQRLTAWENTPIRENGQIVGTLSSGIDITERKKMEEELQQRSQELQSSFVQLAETTSRVLGVRDPYTREHEQRVAELAREVGKRMELDEEKLLGLYIGGVLHDIGKIVVPETILTKPGELSDIEWRMIKSHPEVGYNQILKDTNFPWPVAEMTLHHHERLDGSGYPDGLKGDQLTKEVRILGAVDVVEAMSTRRPYREARSKERTLNVLRDEKGTKLDPEVVDILVDTIEEGEIQFGGE